MTIGNHDSRRNFLRAFEYLEDGASASWRKYVIAADTGPVRLVLLDSLLFSNTSWGLVGGAQRTWLKDYLRRFDDKPAILFLHHDVAPGTSLLDVNRLWDIIVPARQVKALVHGHSHRFGFTTSTTATPSAGSKRASPPRTAGSSSTPSVATPGSTATPPPWAGERRNA